MVAFGACASGGEVADEEQSDSPPPEEVAAAQTPQAADQQPATAHESDCLGELVPPRGEAGARYLQETAIATDATFEELTERARNRLRDRLCQETLCAELERHIDQWSTKESGSYRCVMAVVRKSNFEEWKAQVERDLVDRIYELGEDPMQSLADEIDGDSPRIVIGNIEDHNIAGGPRVTWLRTSLENALNRLGGYVVRRPADWSGQADHPDFDAYVSATIQELSGEHNPVRVDWKLRHEDRIIRGDSITFPEVAAPEVDPDTYLPELDIDDEEVSMFIHGQEGGGVCEGQQAELQLETDEDMYVRVLNLYGRSSGMTIYPVNEEDDGLIEGGQPVSIGEFEGLKHGDMDASRFIVIASPTRENLGRFETADRFCRLPAPMPEQLQQGENLPDGDDVYFYETGFRLTEGDECERYSLSEQRADQIREVIRDAPSCW